MGEEQADLHPAQATGAGWPITILGLGEGGRDDPEFVTCPICCALAVLSTIRVEASNLMLMLGRS